MISPSRYPNLDKVLCKAKEEINEMSSATLLALLQRQANSWTIITQAAKLQGEIL